MRFFYFLDNVHCIKHTCFFSLENISLANLHHQRTHMKISTLCSCNKKYIPLLALALCLFGVLIYHIHTYPLAGNKAQEYSNALNTSARIIDQKLCFAQDVSEKVQNDAIAKRVFLENTAQHEEAEEQIKKLVLSAKNASNIFSCISFYSQDGRKVLRLATTGESLDLNTDPCLVNNPKKRFAQQKEVLHFDAEQKKFFMAMPISIDEKLVGSIVFTVHTKNLALELGTFLPIMPKGAQLILHDAAKIITASTTHAHDFTAHITSGIGVYDLGQNIQKGNVEGTGIFISSSLVQINAFLSLRTDVKSFTVQKTPPITERLFVLFGLVLLACIALFAAYKVLLTKNPLAKTQENNNLLAQMHLPYGIYTHPKRITINAKLMQILGRESKETCFENQEFSELLHPNDKHKFHLQAHDRADFDEWYYIQVRLAHASGYWVHALLQGSIQKDAEGDLLLAKGLIIPFPQEDEHRVKIGSANASLQDLIPSGDSLDYTSDFYHSTLYGGTLLYQVVNCIPDYIYFKDTEGNVLGGNKAFLNILGVPLSAIRGKPLNLVPTEIVYTEKEYAYFKNEDEYLLKNNAVSRTEIPLSMKDGTPVVLEIYKSAIRDYEGKPLGIVGIGRDISAHKASEKALSEAEQMASAANKAKSEFLANMSHEIRTPLNGILGLNQLALQDTTSETTKNYLEKVDFSAKTLLKIVNDILDFSKIEAGHMELEYSPFSMKKTLEFAIDMLANQAHDKKIDLNLECESTLPAYIYGDPLRMRQVLLNLLSNAVKFTTKGSVILKVLATNMEEEACSLSVSIEDTGIGMNEEAIGKIFKPFTQADSSTTRLYGGTGLGLPITNSLIAAMGSKLTIKSTPNVGTICSFILHCKHAEHIESQNVGVRSHVDNSSLLGKKVLLVEDNEINQMIAVEVLERLGLKISVAVNGQQGYDMAMAEDFDLVLMDVQMPIMDGITATKLLRESLYNKPIIAMTANALAEDKEKVLQAGMQEQITKPFDLETLEKCIRQWLGTSV